MEQNGGLSKSADTAPLSYTKKRLDTYPQETVPVKVEEPHLEIGNIMNELHSITLSNEISSLNLRDHEPFKNESPERKGVIYKAIDTYFEPKAFERSGKLYKKLGVPLFRDFVPWPSLGLRRKFFKEPLIKGVDGLKRWEELTRKLEVFHIEGFVGMSGLTAALTILVDPLKGLVFGTGLNLVSNVYPIMLQRYNRLRIYSALNRIEERKGKIQNKNLPTE